MVRQGVKPHVLAEQGRAPTACPAVRCGGYRGDGSEEPVAKLGLPVVKVIGCPVAAATSPDIDEESGISQERCPTRRIRIPRRRIE